MFLTIHTPVTVISWESLIAHIAIEDRAEVDLVRVLTDMEDPNIFQLTKPSSQRLLLEQSLGEEYELIDRIMESTTGVKVPQAFLYIHYYTVLFATLSTTTHFTLGPLIRIKD